MSISRIAAGTVATAGTVNSIDVPYPASPQAGDLLVLAIVNKFPTNGPSTPDGWTAISGGQASGGAGADTGDSGHVYATVFVKVSDGTETGNITVTVTNMNCGVGRMWLYRIGAGNTWSYACTNGADNTEGTAWSVTGAADLGLAAGDVVVAVSGANTDTYTASGQAVSASGITEWGAATELNDSGTNLGGDVYMVVSEHPVTTGTSSAAPVFTMTWAGSFANVVCGGTVLLRLREVAAGGGTYTLPADSGGFTLAGQSTGLKADRKLGAATGGYDLAGAQVGLYRGYPLSAQNGGFTLAGSAVGLRASRKLAADTAGYDLAGASVGLLKGYLLSIASADHVLAGQDVSLLAARRLAAYSGAHTLAGQDADLLKASRLAAESGGFSLSGTPAGLFATRRIAGEAGVYVLSGQDVGLVYTPAGAYILTAVGGVFSFSGQDAGLLYGRNLVAELGVWSLSPTEVALLFGRRMAADGGAFLLAGSDAALLFGRKVFGDAGGFVLAGEDVALLYSGGVPAYILTADGGVFALSGEDVALLLGRSLPAGAGAFSFSGKDVRLALRRHGAASRGGTQVPQSTWRTTSTPSNRYRRH